MWTARQHVPLARFLLIAVTVGVVGPIEAAWASSKQVLVLYSTSRDSHMSATGDRELPRLLEQGLGDDLNFYFSEYIDQGRFPDTGYQAAFSDFLRVKYKGQRIDLVIAIQSAAVEFINQRRDELFPDTPVVYLALAPLTRRLANSTGVIAQLDLAKTLALAVALQPNVRRVFVVSGAGRPDKEYERMTRVQLQPFESRLEIIYLSGLTTKDLEARLATLPEDSIVYYLVVYRDGAGQAFGPTAYLERVAAVARAPTYTWVDAVMDHGIVGGSLLDRQAMMEAVANLAIRVLQGEQADSIPMSSPDLHVSQVDWRQLRRWGISEARVPAGTLVRFRELSAWDRYKAYILSAVALLLAQTALITALLVQGSRRRHAEDRVRGSQAELRTSYERLRDLGARLLNAQETERSRIARELHDDIGQQMTLLMITLELLRGAHEEETEQKLTGEALTRANAIARSVHDLSYRLHPAKLRLLGLVAALHALQRELSESEIPITFEHDNVPSTLPPDLTLCLFRVVQEALQNALKYSKAYRISVRLNGRPEGLSLTIVDDGVGFDVEAALGQGLGLISMGERLEAIGATLEMHSSPGAGTRLEVTVPVDVVNDRETAAV